MNEIEKYQEDVMACIKNLQQTCITYNYSDRVTADAMVSLILFMCTKQSQPKQCFAELLKTIMDTGKDAGLC